MRKERGFRTFIVFAAIVALLALSVGYATLSNTFNISGTTTVKKTDWSVNFKGLQAAVVTGAGNSISTTFNDTTFTFAASLTKPGDSVTYIWSVTNDGDVDAKLITEPILSGIDDAAAKHISYSLTYEDGKIIEVNDELAKDETKKLKLVIKYDESATTTSSEDVTLSLSTTLTYVQK